jgi:hypothetical protein
MREQHVTAAERSHPRATLSVPGFPAEQTRYAIYRTEWADEFLESTLIKGDLEAYEVKKSLYGIDYVERKES